MTVTVLNYDEGVHSFNAPGLKVNAIILGGSATKPHRSTFTFVAAKKGVFAWHCDPKCDPWAMKHDGYMEKGFVTID